MSGFKALFGALGRSLRRPKHEHAFVVVTAVHNGEQFVRRHLDSVFGQKYPKERYRHVIIDDASTDATSDLVQLFIGDTPHANIDYVRNDQRHGGCANLTRAFRDAAPDAIVLQVDGDDWLADPNVLSYVNGIYQNPEVWMTCNSWAFSDGRPGLNCSATPEHVVRAGSYRDQAWTSSHLHSFRARLFRHVREESLIDPATGQYFGSAVDMAHYFPMLELASAHTRHLDRVLYIYNLHQDSIENADRERQLGCERRIRSLERYRPLEQLDA